MVYHPRAGGARLFTYFLLQHFLPFWTSGKGGWFNARNHRPVIGAGLVARFPRGFAHRAPMAILPPDFRLARAGSADTSLCCRLLGGGA